MHNQILGCKAGHTFGREGGNRQDRIKPDSARGQGVECSNNRTKRNGLAGDQMVRIVRAQPAYESTVATSLRR